MKKKILIGSIIAVVILVLVSFSSVVGYSSVKNTQEEIITSEWDFEYCKDYLFETFVEIADNEDVKDLMNNNNQNRFPTNSYFRYNSMFSFRKNTNKLTIENLDFIYNMGLKIFDIIGEEKALEILSSVKITNPELFTELDEITMNNQILSERISTLHEMNSINFENGELFEWGFPIICGIAIILALVPYALMIPIWMIEGYLLVSERIIIQIFGLLLALITSPISGMAIIFGAFLVMVCFDGPTPF